MALRVRDVDVLTAQADDAEQLEDRELLDRATALGRSLFTQDEDLLALAFSAGGDGGRRWPCHEKLPSRCRCAVPGNSDSARQCRA